MISDIVNISGFLPILVYGLLLLHDGTCWTYHSSNRDMNYTEAEKWCKGKFTNLVAIQTKEEIEYLNATFNKNANYYWIGLRKINNEWRWVGTNKTLNKSAENWAAGEPNGKKLNEDCVEIYIKREKDSGKWNDERCDKKKGALCYTASCKPDSCSGHGECVETINNYTCNCDAGFYGRDCEHVQTCEPLREPEHGTLECNKPEMNFIYNSSCRVQCLEGYETTGQEPIWCTSSGKWSAPTPMCKAVKCDAVPHPERGYVNCSNSDTELVFNSTCEFRCEEGYALRGSSQIQCSPQGRWSAPIPHCEVMKCEVVPQPERGFVNCSHTDTELVFNSTCEFRCEEGYTLRGSSQIQCSSQGHWSAPIPQCEVMKCEVVPQPERGFVNCSHMDTELVFNSTCEFRCEEGYALRGSSQIQCSSQGRWSALIPHCEVMKCDMVPQPERGFVNCSHMETELVFNSTCEFRCEEGYALRGSSQIQCSSQGHWSAPIPHCEVMKCEAVTQPERGFVNCSNTDTELVFNSTCEFRCEEGYTLRGSSQIQCSPQGRWSAPMPHCEVAKCERLTAPEKGFLNCSRPDFAYRTLCEVSCMDGWVLNSSSYLLQCLASGNWTAELPTCKAQSQGDFVSFSSTAAAAAIGVSVLSIASLLVWLLKRIRRKVKKFSPASSYHHLVSEGTFQSSAHLI
ncbi:E-selectin [Eublepharis macularius]|uniref:E-selectin n=1 Tax=Eublepharis macularius TaxID=481883 RepID=A0AA97KZM8_EUBMA|nr:E-selectin [Eublepharis macularius]